MNIQHMMKQAQQMQKKIQEDQETLNKMEFEGISGNGLVQAKMQGTGLFKSINIDKSLIDPDEIEILEDLILLAINDAKQNFNKKSDEIMNSATAGLNLKNMKLPF